MQRCSLSPPPPSFAADFPISPIAAPCPRAPELRSCQWLSAADKQKSEARHCSWAFERGRGARRARVGAPQAPHSTLNWWHFNFHTRYAVSRERQKPSRKSQGEGRKGEAKTRKEIKANALSGNPSSKPGGVADAGRGRALHWPQASKCKLKFNKAQSSKQRRALQPGKWNYDGL